MSFIIFRLAQPYAFSGPGLLGIKPNPEWLRQIREQRSQATVEVDFPPAMQWARRSKLFSFANLTVWGLGLPLGLLAWAGFLWAGWEILRGKWRTHLLLWGWTAAYFVWQSMALNPTMRYQLPIYPCLAIFAAWGVVHLWDVGKEKRSVRSKFIDWRQLASLVVAGVVLVSSLLYAVGFASIYTRPITRVEGSRWIYQNIPGPINLHLQSPTGTLNQPLPFPYNSSIMAGLPYQVNFSPQASGLLTEVYLPKVRDLQLNPHENNLTLTILSPDGTTLASTSQKIKNNQQLGSSGAEDPAGQAFTLQFEQPVQLEKGESYILRLEVAGAPPVALLDGQTSLRFISDTGEYTDYPAFSAYGPDWKGAASTTQMTPKNNGVLVEIFLPVGDRLLVTDQPVKLAVTMQPDGSEPGLQPETLLGRVVTQDDPRGPGYAFTLNEPVYLNAGQSLQLGLAVLENQAAISLSGAGIANEGEWDDGMPVRIDGYDGFGGIYPLDLNFNMYWDDNPEKMERFLRILDQAEYVVITSNRQWGSLPRIPERFPMTTEYYRNLLGCPPEQDIVWCYRVAQPGQFQGGLGFDLVKVFQSDPQVGPLRVNDQFAEEAFTVYDHPKVLIFQKNENYDAQKTREILSSVDFTKVNRLAPLKFTSHPADLLLPLERWVEQQRGGTWVELFNPDALVNRSQVFAVVLWYLSLAALGLIVYPILRLALPGLSDRGYPLARTAGLLILSYLVWIAGSLRVPFSRGTISLVLLLLLILGGILAYLQRHELGRELRKNIRYYLIIESLFLAFFVLVLLIRLGNPDLWHPYKGGEKPMDFAYFNAILKSTSFPPYDPWFAGGYLNYYYYGFVFVGVLVKWLGITPAVAYNIILPTLFALIAMGAFSIAWNLYLGVKPPDPNDQRLRFNISPYWVGLSGALGMALLGNLGTVKMIYQGFQRLVAPGGAIEDSTLLMRLVWAGQGFLRNLTGSALPYGLGEWYWNPSRVIPSPGEVEPITEFPFFTVIYADLHAHLFSLTLALLALGFCLSVVLGRGRWKNLLSGALGFLLGALAIGALRPTNTWDFYTYLALGSIAVAYGLWRYYQPLTTLSPIAEGNEGIPSRSPLRAAFVNMPVNVQRIVVTGGGVLLLVALATLLYLPYSQWYGLGYGKIAFWQGLRTPLPAYFTHWGLFLFIIVSWLIWETRDWMASTPVVSLQKLQPYRSLIIGAVVFLLLFTVAMAIKLPLGNTSPFGNGVVVAWVALPLAAWAGLLLLRPDQPDAKRITLFLIGTGLTLSLMVEVIVLVGDIGRMNTVFKFYLQVWTLMAVCAAAALGWLLCTLPEWLPGWRNAWSVSLAILIAGAALFPLTASRAKILDRMTDTAPHTLDGMKYMAYATYDWEGVMDLSQDYRAIRWMQEHVEGSPVIVEANLRDLYRWGSRFSIYTGLPGVVGWEWQQQQQRALTPGSWVSDRIAEIDNFYTTTDLSAARAFLKKYNVKYIVLGQLERNHYPGPGLDKFANKGDQSGASLPWREIYRDGTTVIFEVNS